ITLFVLSSCNNLKDNHFPTHSISNEVQVSDEPNNSLDDNTDPSDPGFDQPKEENQYQLLHHVPSDYVMVDNYVILKTPDGNYLIYDITTNEKIDFYKGNGFV